MKTVYIRGAGNTEFGKLSGRGVLDLMMESSGKAIVDAGMKRCEIDGILCGYATTMPHLMLSTVFCERAGIRPKYAHTVQIGGATGSAMIMLARELVGTGRCRNVLVVGGENRMTGQSRDSSIQTLAQVGDPDFEVPNGASVPAYYALLASEYFVRTGAGEADLAELAVLMRQRASENPDSHFSTPLSVSDVLASRPIATPLKLLDCCPISDGSAALIVSAEPGSVPAVSIVGAGQAHFHQHVSAIEDFSNTGASASARQAFTEAGMSVADIDYLGIYDSFTITLAMLLEETGFALPGGASEGVRNGRFDPDGELPLNTHGGLLSFGHSGVAGGMCHSLEAFRQLSGRAGSRQIRNRNAAYIHGDGGVLSSHVSLIFKAHK
ncbi:MAG: thiolase family protein [Alcaligenaceae bacterium]|nr:thiolase family protein [Alcaligenaceae bacterium]